MFFPMFNSIDLNLILYLVHCFTFIFTNDIFQIGIFDFNGYIYVYTINQIMLNLPIFVWYFFLKLSCACVCIFSFPFYIYFILTFFAHKIVLLLLLFFPLKFISYFLRFKKMFSYLFFL